MIHQTYKTCVDRTNTHEVKQITKLTGPHRVLLVHRWLYKLWAAITIQWPPEHKRKPQANQDKEEDKTKLTSSSVISSLFEEAFIEQPLFIFGLRSKKVASNGQ